MTSLQFFGTGGGFDPAYGNSAALVHHQGQALLLDCGFTVYPELARRGLTGEFSGILLTHLHCDHSGSLAMALQHRAYLKTGAPPTIWYANDAQRDDLIKLLTVQAKDPFKYATFKPLAELPGVRALDTFGRHSAGYQTFAYAFEDPTDNTRLAYSGDLAEPDFFFAWLDSLPAAPRTRVLHDITFERNAGGHTFYRDLLPHRARYPELFGYHCDPTQNPPDNPIPLAYDTPELLLPVHTAMLRT